MSPPRAAVQAEEARFLRRLDVARKAAGVTRGELGQAIGMDSGAASRLFAQIRGLRLGEAVLLAQHLEVTAAELLAPPECDQCEDRPPAGFRCLTCGRADGQ